MAYFPSEIYYTIFATNLTHKSKSTADVEGGLGDLNGIGAPPGYWFVQP